MDTEIARVWTARLLLGFVLVTLGFAAGRRTAALPAAVDDDSAGFVAAGGARVVVYAAHRTFRCAECSQIEWLARELVESEFAAELADGRLVFRTVDYGRDEAFARKYNISSSTVVVARVKNGEEQVFARLDAVWTKVDDREAFFTYVRGAILAKLGREGGV